ncbi:MULTISPECIES: CTB family bacteriocin [unclassified Nodularia (in: cyanobacteria)]|uniref:CTB family bacteriocin n=1 Tax=unclassified Nodularia (in: cyanobacteria) TaxID=2656917 RepID=UPI001882342B|nr:MULTISPECIES: CTB family bacteriocin [unclassified Nodularia (in: cyanobacteria)]MBE9199969.1 CTB family bacteriocin [Nodularia sp. LEGE 06071]MCC2693650.1 CTB family bacteriocin [Nodularia sp. LEGE 04288]
MSDQIITSDWFAELELSDRQQELLVGGVNYQLNDNNFAQGSATKKNSSNNSPEGNSSELNTQLADVNSNATSFLSNEPTEFPALANSEELNQFNTE